MKKRFGIALLMGLFVMAYSISYGQGPMYWNMLMQMNQNHYNQMQQNLQQGIQQMQQQTVVNPYNFNFIYTPDAEQVPQQAPSPTPNSNTPSSSSNSSHKCRVCSGSGEVINEVWMGSGSEKWCERCGKTVYTTHTHKICKTCNGSGWISY